ncbi:MAG: UbiH/UbiF/VisC/COQ6 family ubiquinone biosynthesis hydroxylase [Cellvibrionaceae bacterium]|nr:UbiH/UbiF/VisC/COQ6 family ubiquinone biosynthesis hydroxylase [Cellvibrionaceae bacterium]
MNRPAHHYDLVIVGAGIVGASLAALLANRQQNHALKIALIDKQPAPVLPERIADKPAFDPRVLALTPFSEQLLQDLKAWPRILQQGACRYRHMAIWDNEGTGHIEFNARSLQQASLGTIVENRAVLDALLHVLQQQRQIHIFRETAVTALQRQQQRVELLLDNGSELSADLLVAADGAHSKIRQQLALPVREWSYQQQAIVTTVKTQGSHQYTAWQNFQASGPLAFLPLDHPSEQYSAIVWSADNDRAASLRALTDTAFAEALTRLSENRLGKVIAVDKRFCIPLMQRHAIDYFSEQAVLIGDAAHSIHPLAGQGVNLGLLDAQALAIEISRAHQRRLPLSEASILRRYQRQRKRHNLEMMLLMEGFKQLFGRRELSIRWLRNQGMRSINAITPIKHWLAKQAMGIS